MDTTTNRTLRALALLAAIGAISVPGFATAQAQPTLFEACFTNSGTVYLINQPGLDSDCKNPNHTRFSWTGAVGADHGLLSGLADDDHHQYLLANGVRNSTNGFAVTGSVHTGSIPVEGPGVRMMWYPGKAAFRAGEVTGDAWDDENVGFNSVALGFNSTASTDNTVAMGWGAKATALQSTAIGTGATASGRRSTALGANIEASGEHSTAMGARASTNFQDGSFVYGDATPEVTQVETNVTKPNSFVVRAQNIWFGKSGDQTDQGYFTTSTGAFLSDGGTWTNASSQALKEDFRDEDGETVLARIAELPIRSWSYKAEEPSVRHLGPTSEDFQAAFGLGGSDEAIATVDIAGVNLLAVQALENRTRELRAENEMLKKRVEELEALVRSLADADSERRRDDPGN